MTVTITGKLEVALEENGSPPPPELRKITIRGRRDGDATMTFSNLEDKWWDVVKGNAGATCAVTYDSGPPVVVRGVRCS